MFIHSLSEWSFCLPCILESTFRASNNMDQITEFTGNLCFEREVLAFNAAEGTLFELFLNMV